ncbi:unnamed protein product [Toxocara canis]|uniref:Laminin EGF-like domain-containing protein n=2 Tax=Toxocara canis TaxID=6265 RepID=A0A183UDH0_TOXCA|nr:unnamed protein product [Toxocara canis]
MSNYEGDNFEWSICSAHGRVNAITGLCECYANFAPPFCEHCIDGFWGQQCSLSTVTATDERSLTVVPRTYIIAGFGAALVLILLTISMATRAVKRWKRVRRTGESPPPYSLVDQLPPPQYCSVEEENLMNNKKLMLRMVHLTADEYCV